MLKGIARDLRDFLKAIYCAVRGKLDLALRGFSRAAASCQISEIRKKYVDLGLSDRSGVFVEIGAFDGESHSNTSFLADQGWKGVYVEPIPKFYRRMRLRHMFNNIAGENVGIADEAGKTIINMMGELSTMNQVAADHYLTRDWSRPHASKARPLEIHVDTLEAVLTRNSVPTMFDLMVVDVEGSEEGIINQLLASRWRPRVLIVELCDVHIDFADNAELTGSHRRVREKLISDGYREYMVHPINTIFALN